MEALLRALRGVKGISTREILAMAKDARLVANGEEDGCVIQHYLLLNGKVLEVVIPASCWDGGG
jgi:hypothetical protein